MGLVDEVNLVVSQCVVVMQCRILHTTQPSKVVIKLVDISAINMELSLLMKPVPEEARARG